MWVMKLALAVYTAAVIALTIRVAPRRIRSPSDQEAEERSLFLRELQFAGE